MALSEYSKFGFKALSPFLKILFNSWFKIRIVKLLIAFYVLQELLKRKKIYFLMKSEKNLLFFSL